MKWEKIKRIEKEIKFPEIGKTHNFWSFILSPFGGGEERFLYVKSVFLFS